MRHVAKEKLALLVLIISTGGVCQKAATPAEPVATPRSQVTGSSAVLPKLAGRDFYVAPAGSSAGDGSLGSPWDLATALGQPAAVQPGDTIWLRGGTYVGTFTSDLTGTPVSPIKVCQYPGERTTLDAGTTPPSHNASTLAVNGAYTWYMSFEVTNSDTARTNSDADSNPPNMRTVGVAVFGPGVKLINMVVHDTGQGVGLWTPSGDTEAYGNLIYYNGWDGPDRGHGHGIYAQNQAPHLMRIADNILFQQFGLGIHVYTEGGYIDNIALEGNTAFANGALSHVSRYTDNLLIGGLRVANNPSMISNFTYTPLADGGSDNLGYKAGCTNGAVTGNYFAGYTALHLVNCSSGLSMTGNTFCGALADFNSAQYPSNAYFLSRPTNTQVFVRPNYYEPGRANITVFNWSLAPTVNVDLTGVLTVGSSYEIRNAQDFFGAPALTGTYAGGTLALPMSGLSVETPVGVAAPPATGPEFNAFVLLSTGVGRTVPAAPKSARPKARTLDRRS